jgi:hypothetical protein
LFHKSIGGYYNAIMGQMKGGRKNPVCLFHAPHVPGKHPSIPPRGKEPLWILIWKDAFSTRECGSTT